jgi:excisionase family DNA binding protein
LRREERVWLRVPEAAAHFAVPRSRMYLLIQQGVIPAIRLGERAIRVDIREAERVLARNHQVVHQREP